MMLLYKIYIFSCESNITQIIRISDKQKLFECDFPNCFRFFESLDKLGLHKSNIHNLTSGFENNANIIRQENYSSASQTRFSHGNINTIQNVSSMSSNLNNSSLSYGNITSGMQSNQMYPQINQ
jgi:hypothetical protein